MSYERSVAECNWCGKAVETHDAIACAACYAALEKARDYLAEEILRLHAELGDMMSAQRSTP